MCQSELVMCQGEYVGGHLWNIAPLVTDDSDTKTNYLKSFKTPLAATSDLKHTSAKKNSKIYTIESH